MSLIESFIENHLAQWNQKSTAAENRWVQIFNFAESQNRTIDNLSLLLEFAFSIPGTSCEVERLFSIIGDIWGSDKGQMKLETVESMLNVRYNSNQTCKEFFDSIKDDKKVLRQVHESAKYK
jgi:hypothetical protein